VISAVEVTPFAVIPLEKTAELAVSEPAGARLKAPACARPTELKVPTVAAPVAESVAEARWPFAEIAPALEIEPVLVSGPAVSGPVI
jgi:hypothetical protein